MLTCAINVTVSNLACCSCRHKTFKAALKKKNMYTEWQGDVLPFPLDSWYNFLYIFFLF